MLLTGKDARTILTILLIPEILVGTLYIAPSILPSAHADSLGQVCITENNSSQCPIAPPLFNTTFPSSPLTVSVVINNSQAFNVFDVSILTNHTVLKPASVSTTGTVMQGSLTTLSDCIGGLGLNCAGTDNADTLHYAVSSNALTSSPVTGLLFTATFDVMAKTNLTQIGFQTGCSRTSVANFCVTINNGSPTPVPETVQGAKYTNQPYFDFQPSENPITVDQRGTIPSGVLYLNVTSINDFQGTVNISAFVSPSGPTAIPSPNSLTVSLASPENFSFVTVHVPSSATAGEYNVTFVATSGSLPPNSLTIQLTVPTTDFTITATPTPVVFNVSASGSSILSIESLGNFSGTVTLRLAASPGLEASLAGGSIFSVSSTSPASTTLTVNATTAGTYNVNITATSGSLSHTITVAVLPTDFAMSLFDANPLVIPIPQSANKLIQFTDATTTPFNATITVKTDVYLVQPPAPPSGLPPILVPSTGISVACVGNSYPNEPSEVVLNITNDYRNFSTCTVTASSTGNYTVTVIGTSGAISHAIPFSVEVLGPDFKMSAVPNTLSIVGGSNASATINLTAELGFTDTIHLAAEVNGGGPLTVLSPSTVELTTSATSTLTVSAGSAPAGTYDILVTGIGFNSAIHHTLVIPLTILSPPPPPPPRPSPFFAIAANPTGLNITQSGPRDSSLTLASFYNFTGTINLSTTTVPGLDATISSPIENNISSVSLAPNSTDTLTLSVVDSGNVPTGSYQETVIAASGSLSETMTVQIIVVGPPPPPTAHVFLAPGNITDITKTALSSDPRLVYTGPTPFGAGDTIIYNFNGGSTYTTSDTVIGCVATTTCTPTSPSVGTPLNSDPRLKYYDNPALNQPTFTGCTVGMCVPVTGGFSCVTGSWCAGPTNGKSVVYDTNNLGYYGYGAITSSPTSNGSGLYITIPEGIVLNPLTSGTITFAVNISNSPPINLFSVSIRYNRAILRVAGVNSTGDVLNSTGEASILYYCIDGINQVSPSAPCLPGIDAPGVVTYSLVLLGGEGDAITNGLLFHVTFNIVGSGLAQLHMLQVVLANAGSSIPTTTTDAFFTNGYCGSTVCRPPSVNMTITPAAFTVGQLGTFNATVVLNNPDDTVLNYTWSFDDLTPSIVTTFPYAQHIYQNAGTYMASVEIIDKYNVVWQTSITVTVLDTTVTVPSVALNPASLTIQEDSSETSTVTIPIQPASSGLISVGVAAYPNGLIVSLSNATTTGPITLLVTAGSLTPPGFYTVIVGAKIGTSVGATILNVTVTGPPADFTIGLISAPQTLTVGSTGNYPISLGRVNWFDGMVTLSTLVSPTIGLPCTTVPGNISIDDNATLTCSASAPGSYTVTIKGQTGPTTRTAVLQVTVVLPPDFTLTADPASRTIQAGTSNLSTITVAPSSGFTGIIVLSVLVSPPGPTTALSSTTITGGAGTSTLTVSIGDSMTAGTYAVTVTGTSGSLSQSTTIAVTVVSPPDFTLSADPASRTIQAGTSNLSTITVAPSSGFTGTIVLSVLVSPPGPTTALTATTIPGASGISTLTISIDNSVTPGTYTVTVTGISGSISRTTTISVTVTTVQQVATAGRILGLDPTLFYSITGIIAVILISGLVIVVRRRKPWPR
jgi:uncharacterized membrane protein